jgi:hypothetical protein
MCCSARSSFRRALSKCRVLDMTTDQQQENCVLCRMLNTLHIHHKPDKKSSLNAK